MFDQRIAWNFLLKFGWPPWPVFFWWIICKPRFISSNQFEFQIFLNVDALFTIFDGLVARNKYAGNRILPVGHVSFCKYFLILIWAILGPHFSWTCTCSCTRTRTRSLSKPIYTTLTVWLNLRARYIQLRPQFLSFLYGLLHNFMMSQWMLSFFARRYQPLDVDQLHWWMLLPIELIPLIYYWFKTCIS